jgi:hypothetical protein
MTSAASGCEYGLRCERQQGERSAALCDGIVMAVMWNVEWGAGLSIRDASA